jgi:hypothetical protein
MNSFIHPVNVKNIGEITLIFEGEKGGSQKTFQSLLLVKPTTCSLATTKLKLMSSKKLHVANFLYAIGGAFMIEAKQGKPGVEFLSFANLQPTLE